MEVILKPWQQMVIDQIDSQVKLVNTETMLSLSDFSRNILTRIHIGLPKGQGHTFLATYIASKYPTALIYKDTKHWKEICKQGLLNDSQTDKKTYILSAFEISHNIFCTVSNERSNCLQKIKEDVANKQVIVIDNATDIIETFPRVIEWLFTVSTGQIVLLG